MAENAVVWFRRDLRLHDNAALTAAIESGKKIVPLYIWEPGEESPWQMGAASRVWLHYSLLALSEALHERRSSLLIRKSNFLNSILQLRSEVEFEDVFANSIYEPAWLSKDLHLQNELQKRGINLHLTPGELLYDPSKVRTSQGKPFQVFTAFWKSCTLNDPIPAKPLNEPEIIPSSDNICNNTNICENTNISQLQLLPSIRWDSGINESWCPGESGAKSALKVFLESAAEDYSKGRDIPGDAGTSRLSPHLHFGEISIRKVWHEIASAESELKRQKKENLKSESFQVYLKELGWREFAHHVLCNFPETPMKPLREEYARFPFSGNKEHLIAWQKGLTGYPMVDAGMRELWHTGWMHNRVRMVVASFLVKHLLLSWKDGAAWFWDTLVDADLANNTLGWQWSAGCGADAAPYFRIFNPVLQGEKFDPEGTYVRKWVPELAKLSNDVIHKPWFASSAQLRSYGVTLGKSYPEPIVEHSFARKRALAALSMMRG